MKFNSFAKAAAVALVVAGAAGAAQARSNVFFSVSAPIAPGVVIGASNGYGYAPAPVYYGAPAPAYYEPAYSYAPAPVYYGPSYVVRSAPVVYGYGGYYGRPVYRHRPHYVHYRY